MRRAFHYVLSQTHRQEIFENIERKFTFVRQGGEMALPDRAALLDDLINAVLHSYRISATYRQFNGEIESFSFSPYAICIYDHQLYVLGQRSDEQLRLLRFSRILSLDERKQVPFDYPSNNEYDPRQIFADSFGIFPSRDSSVENITIRLHARWATHAQTHRWHSSQRVESDDSGSVVVHLRAKVCPEVEAWILGFGEEAEVLEPQRLRAKIENRIQQANRMYSGTEDQG